LEGTLENFERYRYQRLGGGIFNCFRDSHGRGAAKSQKAGFDCGLTEGNGGKGGWGGLKILEGGVFGMRRRWIIEQEGVLQAAGEKARILSR